MFCEVFAEREGERGKECVCLFGIPEVQHFTEHLCVQKSYTARCYTARMLYVPRAPPNRLKCFSSMLQCSHPSLSFEKDEKKKRAGVATFVKTIFVRRVLWHLLPKRFASQVPPSAASGTEGAN